MIVKTDAVVLHARRIRESSKIVTLYTREYGKLSVMARGVMQPRNKFGAVLQPMAHLSVVLYRKEGRELQNLSAAESAERFAVLNGSLERMTAGLTVVEMVNAVMHDEDRNEAIFDLVVATLRALDNPDAAEAPVQLWFLTRLAGLLGYALNMDTCGICGEHFDREREPVPFSVSIGAPLCAEHRAATPYRPLRLGTFRLLESLLGTELEASALLKPELADTTELVDILTTFIRYHVEGLRRLKVRSVSAKVLAEGNDAL